MLSTTKSFQKAFHILIQLIFTLYYKLGSINILKTYFQPLRSKIPWVALYPLSWSVRCNSYLKVSENIPRNNNIRKDY